MRSSHLPPNRRVSRPSPEPPAESRVVQKKKVKQVKKPPKAAGSVEEEAPPPRPSSPEATSKREVAAKSARKKARKIPPRVSAWLTRLSLVTGIIVVVAASVLVAWGLRRYLRSSPRFALRHVVVDGAARRTGQQLAERGGLASGINIFTIDEERAAASIEADPWIAAATVTKDLPNTVHVVVTERDPRALTVVEGQLYLVDSHGEIFKEHRDGDPDDLPVVTGVGAEELADDREAVRQRLRRALDLVADLERAEIAKRFPVQELAVRPDSSVRAVIGKTGITLVFGPPPYTPKIAKASRILEELRYRKVEHATLFLDNQAHPERVVVRMQ